ncbi:MAG: NmrA family NAD(P)-binding protein [Deltaproteobacteria bacterium]|nr:NmrA family NAD(P)-binding protein [Deltaproteobacteria bacterium]
MFVVAGVSGNTGSVVAETLLAQGSAVRVVVRDASKGAAWKARGAEVAVADVADAKALGEALKGAAGAYLLVPPFGWGAADPVAEQSTKVAGIVEAVRAAKPAHVVLLSSIGAQHAKGTGPIASLHVLEEKLRETGVAATFLRAAYFMENWGGSLAGALEGGAVYNGLSAAKKFPQIATRDIGTTAARLLVEPVASGVRVVELSGPEEYSFDDAAAAIGKIAGREVKAVQVPIAGMEGALQGMGASAAVAGLYGEMTDGVNRDHVAWEGGSAIAVRGPTTLEAVLRGLLKK